MQDNIFRQQQLEALEELYHYSQKLIPAIETISEELSGNRQEDTDEYLKIILNGINWIIEVLNRTMDLVNKEGIIIEKEYVNKGILQLGEAVKQKDDRKTAVSLKMDILPFLLVISARASVLTNQKLN